MLTKSSYNKKIIEKIKIVKELYLILNEIVSRTKKHAKEIKKIKEELQKIYRTIVEIEEIFYKYVYSKEIILSNIKYHDLILSHNINGQIETQYNQLIKKLRQLEKLNKNIFYKKSRDYSINSNFLRFDSQFTYRKRITKLMNQYNNNSIYFIVQTCDIYMCDCGHKRLVDNIKSELVCSNMDCQKTVNIYGEIFNLENAANYIEKAAKKHNENKHCRKWLMRIQAKEKFVPSSNVLSILIKKAKSEYERYGNIMSLEGLTCEHVRQWLKDCKINESNLTIYNNNTPLLRKLIAQHFGEDLTPEQLETWEETDILNDCYEILREYNNVIKEPEIIQKLGKKKKSKCYYPYILYHVIQNHIHDNNRLDKLLECIHLQSMDTIKDNDIVLEQVFKNLNFDFHKLY